MSKSVITSRHVEERKRWGDYQNNTNISLVNKYIYFAVDKVANSTIKHYLFSKEYAPVNKSILDLYDPRCSPLLSPYQLPYTPHELLVESDLYKFAFVRDPYSRILSCYLDRVLTQTSRPSREFRRALKKEEFDFKDFVSVICKQSSSIQNSHWRLQADDILFDLVNFDFVGKIENLEEDLAAVNSKIFGGDLDRNILKGNFSPKKTSAKDKVAEYYTQEMLDMVYDSYRKDFELFGYEKIVI
ncbi:sulfotransferase family protein [Halomonas caseinilytica]|uniref:sulfotransferase family protein n=1 Tax=Halomonas caseinilytica TaxID=438744 RepID=UPI0008BA5055|nr:sulfotransferase family protein [Halomonas caseinilytica]SEN43911.1 Sulfotransferase family protein [Halomonas caseinilytica]